jgi:hypothetical protein
VKGISQYSANMVATMLMTMSLGSVGVSGSYFLVRAHSLVLSVAVVSTKMFFVLPATILESAVSVRPPPPVRLSVFSRHDQTPPKPLPPQLVYDRATHVAS